MATVLAYDPADQKRRRRRNRIAQSEIARLLNISQASVSDYENGKEQLPFELTGEDYEVALAQALIDRSKEQAGK